MIASPPDMYYTPIPPTWVSQPTKQPIEQPARQPGRRPCGRPRLISVVVFVAALTPPWSLGTPVSAQGPSQVGPSQLGHLSNRSELGSIHAVAPTPDPTPASIPPSSSVADDPQGAGASAITEARNRANRQAEAVFEAESRIDTLKVEVDDIEAQIDELTAQLEVLEASAAKVAVEQFVGSSRNVIPVLTDGEEVTEHGTREVLIDVVDAEVLVDFDEVDLTRARLARMKDQMQVKIDEAAAERERLDALLERALDDVSRVRTLEADYLEQAAASDASRADAATQARAMSQAARDEMLAAESSLVPLGGDTATVFGLDDGIPTADVQGNERGGRTANGAIFGGRTGAGGSGSDGRRRGPYVSVMRCPVDGFSSYADTWGAPRSGGRRHQGVDMLAPTGTPLVAVVSGRVARKSNTNGGITARVYGDDGNYYYYAHLDRYAGSVGRVNQGDVIGYVGDTGNARGTPHLHFEIHPGGGGPVNPYSSVVAAGC